MPTRSKRYTLRLDQSIFEQVEATAERRGISPADVMRNALDAWFRDEKKRSASDLRHLRVTEYIQIAVDAMIRENHPELRETLVLETDRRMKMHHNV